ncbi:hypothetical protein RSAG8_11644, partial [Rhizoctonia solani AG-8 WAC10335]
MMVNQHSTACLRLRYWAWDLFINQTMTCIGLIFSQVYPTFRSSSWKRATGRHYPS